VSTGGDGEPGGGMLLPAFFTDATPEDAEMSGAIVYLVLLLWVFMGIAIISDVFMAAIEIITSKERVIMRVDKESGEERKIRMKFWNDTIANLTLMALGSSAPEILLSILELIGGNMFAGELGPATVVGSAAFNLFVISAVCVYCIPDGEVRYIQGTKVYMVTSSCSIFAYLWLFIIVSDNQVTIVEGLITLSLFPLLLVVAYAVDVNLCFTRKKDAAAVLVGIEGLNSGDLDKDALAEMRRRLHEKHPMADEEELMSLVMTELEKLRPKSRAAYRIQAVKELTGGKKNQEYGKKPGEVKPAVILQHSADGPYSGPLIGWEALEYAVLERGEPDPDSPGEFTGYVTLTITRTEGSKQCTVYYQTRDGDGMVDPRTNKPRGIARALEDYIPSEGEVVLEAGEIRKDVKIKIIDDVAFEDDEDFFVELNNVKCDDELRLSTAWRTRVTIIDDDEPGFLQFTKDDFQVTEGVQDHAVVFVERINGSSGEVSCKYYTEDRTAHAEVDYEATEGELLFAHSETKKEIRIKIFDDEAYEKSETFRVHLTDATGGATFTENTDGGKEKAVCEVTIKNNADTCKKVNAIQEFYLMQREANRIGTSNWIEQFTGAFYVNGSKDDQAEAGMMDWVMHFLSLPWKLAFAIVPPTDFLGGWLCFFSALGMIAVVTALVGDLAGMLGCSLNLEDDITAITLVALGTSLPDTFASKTAAQQDPYADASVGNVMGSNSVNVFLGLGLPYSIGAVYWSMKFDELKPTWLARQFRGETYADLGYLEATGGRGGFMVPAGSLAFSLAWFCGLAIACIGVLQVRRVYVGGELGGNKGTKRLSAFVLVSFWLVYAVMSILKSKAII
jgi:solute carrier family 8 (sodium/calcium exchanger)